MIVDSAGCCGHTYGMPRKYDAVTNPGGKLPPAADLVIMIEQGKSQGEIAREYGVRPQAVSVKVRRYLGTQPRVTYLPWRIREEHGKRQTPALNAVCYVKWRRGEQVNETELRLARELEETCAALKSVLIYTPEIGFHFRTRRLTDEDIIAVE